MEDDLGVNGKRERGRGILNADCSWGNSSEENKKRCNSLSLKKEMQYTKGKGNTSPTLSQKFITLGISCILEEDILPMLIKV